MAKARGCKCIDKANKALAVQGAEVEWSYQFSSGTLRTIVATAKKPGVRRSHPRLVANFCPFCGLRYPEAKDPWAPKPKKRKALPSDAGAGKGE